MAAPSVAEVALELAAWQQLHPVLDACYTRQAQDVFERVVAASRRRLRLWLSSNGDGLLSLAMLSPRRKVCHLENLAVAPSAGGEIS